MRVRKNGTHRKSSMEIDNAFDAIVECCNTLDEMRVNTYYTKDDVIDSVKLRLHVLIRRLVDKSFFPFIPVGEWEVTAQ